jgi:hypothetical protein
VSIIAQVAHTCGTDTVGFIPHRWQGGRGHVCTAVLSSGKMGAASRGPSGARRRISPGVLEVNLTTHHSLEMVVTVREFRHHGQETARSTGSKSALVTCVMVLEMKPFTSVGTIGGHDPDACRRSARSELKAHSGRHPFPGVSPPLSMVTRLVSFDVTLEA